MMKGERVKGESQYEKDCLQLIHDLNRVEAMWKALLPVKNIWEMKLVFNFIPWSTILVYHIISS